MRKLKNIIIMIVVLFIFTLLFLRIDLTAHVFLSANGDEILYWRGSKYISTPGTYEEGATIAITRDGWDINEVVGDRQHNYVVIRSFLDQYLLIREDYIAPDK